MRSPLILHVCCACALTARPSTDKQLGDSAQSSFAQAWGTGYALDNVRSSCASAACAPCGAEVGAPQASEWQDVFKTALKAVLLLVILDLLRITKDGPWFEQHGARRASCGGVFCAAVLTRDARS